MIIISFKYPRGHILISMKFNIILLMLLLLVTPISTTGDKIQENDTWIYLSDDTKFNETTIDIIQYGAGGNDFIAVARVETKRGFTFPTNEIPGVNLSVADNGILYLTQEGGIPLFGNHTITGTMYFTEDNITVQVNETPIYYITQTPALAISTAETLTYTRHINFSFPNRTTYPTWAYISEDFVISTNQDQQDLLRNYTISRIGLRFMGIPILSMNQVEVIDTHLFTWNSSYNQPVYIAQAEPQKFSEGLSLSQVSEFKEYFLDISQSIIEDETISSPVDIDISSSIPTEITEDTTINYPLLGFLGIILIPILLKKRK